MNQTSALATNMHPRDLIASALVGLDEAGKNVGGEILSGPPLYDSANPGWILGSVQCEIPKRSRRNAESMAICFFVDHMGSGRQDAIARYAETLRMAGLDVEIRPLNENNDREVVWLKGRYDKSGRLLA